jgi:hypothetical protein
MFGGVRPIIIHTPEVVMPSDEEDKQFVGVSDFCKSWPASDVKDWPGPTLAELGKPDNEGGCWTGSKYKFDGGLSHMRAKLSISQSRVKV